jgi:YidC/Oxa1 family membrane protein insertase
MELFSSIGETWQTWAVNPLSDALSLIRDGVGSYAIAIILFTIAIRVFMVPLTVRQLRSQRRMQTLQPEITKMRRKHKNDRQGQSQALMRLYKENGVNPVSGCLPLLVQLPVLLALYGGILTLSGRGLLNEQFLWFNLAREDSTFSVLGESSPTAPTDVHLATTFPVTPLESQVSAEFAGGNANFRLTIDSVEPEDSAAAVASGSASAAFVRDPLDLGLFPSGTSESRLVQAAALVVERDHQLTRLTESEVAQILRGQITDWSQLRLAGGPIRLYGIGNDIGSRDVLSELLLDGEPIAVRIELLDTADNYLTELITDPTGLGISGPILRDDIRMVNIQAEGAERAFSPNVAVLRDKNYALARDAYVYWSPGETDGEQFVQRWWESRNGQLAAGNAGFTRIPIQQQPFSSGGFYISMLALLAGGFQFIQARMMVSKAAEGQQATVNRVMQFMPLIVVIFAWSFQAGLVLYWVISSIIAIVQQYFTTGTGALIPAHWPIARDVSGQQPVMNSPEDNGTNSANDETAGEAVAPPRRRRRRRRRSG